MTGRIPIRVRRPDIQFASFLNDIRIKNIACKGNLGPHIHVVVLLRKSQLELENTVGKWSSTNENDAIKLSQIRHRRDQINTAGSMRFQMLILDRYFVITLILNLIGCEVLMVKNFSDFAIIESEMRILKVQETHNTNEDH